MRLPKFWPDTGLANDALVTLSMAGGLGLAFCLSYRAESPLIMAVSLVSGWIGGLIVGVALMALLCTFFAKPPNQ